MLIYNPLFAYNSCYFDNNVSIKAMLPCWPCWIDLLKLQWYFLTPNFVVSIELKIAVLIIYL